MDTSFFSEGPKSDHPRLYQLNHFNIGERFMSPGRYKRFLRPSFAGRMVRGISNGLLPYYKRKIVHETKSDFDEQMQNVGKDVYISGFWQDERYFTPSEDILRQDLTFRTCPSAADERVIERMSTVNAVSVHIRRGDYFDDRTILNNIGICSMNYYLRAVERMASLVTTPVFYVFSDDIEWAKNNFLINHPTVFVDHNSEENSFQDLRLMSRCRYHIICNSTFSWWGAWLAAREGKIVIAPEVWRRKGPDMYLAKEWIRL